MAVILETSLGDITIDLYTEERPKCSTNFLKLCKMKYYNFCLFHSIQRNLVAQTGDPTGSGRGGDSMYTKLYGDQARFFDMEVNPRIKHKKIGTISMVNNGNLMHGSQFFLTLGDNLDYLDGVHTVFGEVSEGMDILMKINEAYCDNDHRPYKDIRIYHTIVLDDPFDDPPELQFPDRSPEPTKEQLESGRIGAEEDIDDFKDKKEEEIKEILEDREAKANAQILEMVGDLPDVDVAPPENVLFVCKLNPVTTEEDLEIIFSRFGTIVSCEVIKDQKTKESLQYAFIEFANPEQCENAYFKMDNVLIDDRRIHVDFSQSVSKFKWKGKGKGVIHSKDQEEEKPKYVIKDQERRDDRYDLVYEEAEHVKPEKRHKKKKHKEKEGKRSRSTSGSDVDRKKHKKKKKHKEKKHRSPSASPDRAKEKHHDSRLHSNDRSPHTKKKGDRERSPREDRKESQKGRDSDRSWRDDKERRRDSDKYSRDSRDRR